MTRIWYLSAIAGFLLPGILTAQRIDEDFMSPLLITGAEINATVVQPDGKILCGGYIVFFENQRVNNLVRLNPDGTRDNTFSFSPDSPFVIDRIELQNDGD